MDFNRRWTEFALEAEYEHFGMKRIAEAHNRNIVIPIIYDDTVKILWDAFNEHRNQAFITCPDDCLCWDVERFLSTIDALENS